AGRSDIVAFGVAREIGIEPALMRDDDLAVSRDADVELQRVDAHGERIGKGRQGIFRQKAAPAAMRLDIEGHTASEGSCRNETTESRKQFQTKRWRHDGSPRPSIMRRSPAMDRRVVTTGSEAACVSMVSVRGVS